MAIKQITRLACGISGGVPMTLYRRHLAWLCWSLSVYQKCAAGIMVSSLASVMLVTATSSAVAAQATMGGVSINLPSPPDFCELSESNSSDKRMLTTVGDLITKSGNKLLGFSADCGQLRDWRASKRRYLDDYAQYQAEISSLDKPPRETSQQTCAYLRAEGDKIIAKEIPDVNARVEAALKNTKINETTFIGVLEEDPNVCFAGLIQQIRLSDGTDNTLEPKV